MTGIRHKEYEGARKTDRHTGSSRETWSFVGLFGLEQLERHSLAGSTTKDEGQLVASRPL